MNPTEAVRAALNEEPVRIAASAALLVVSGLTLAGVSLPPVVVALAGLVMAELARRKTSPVVKVEQAFHEGYSEGHYRGAKAAVDEALQFSRGESSALGAWREVLEPRHAKEESGDA